MDGQWWRITILKFKKKLKISKIWKISKNLEKIWEKIGKFQKFQKISKNFKKTLICTYLRNGLRESETANFWKHMNCQWWPNNNFEHFENCKNFRHFWTVKISFWDMHASFWHNNVISSYNIPIRHILKSLLLSPFPRYSEVLC